MEQLKYWLWFSQAFGPGNVRIWDILSHFSSPQEAYEAVSSGDCRFLTAEEKSKISSVRLSQSEKMIEYCRQKKYKILTMNHPEYPDRLKGIYNPPAVLFCYGSLEDLDLNPAICVVGTRKPSEYSVRVTQKICAELVKAGMPIISGFALGIDSMAHQAALKNGGRTIAVLGCGLDYNYPKENAPIKEVIARRGAVVTEYFPGTKPNPLSFPARNRIMSGLSLGTLVIEAGVKSGALITAELALQQGKDIFCIPPADIFDERYSGVVRLLRDGAIPVFGHLDILYEYYENFTHKLTAIQRKPVFLPEEHETKKHRTKKTSAPKKQEEAPAFHGELTLEAQKVFDALKDADHMLADELSEQTGIEIGDLLVTLTEMELSGVVEALPGNRYKLMN